MSGSVSREIRLGLLLEYGSPSVCYGWLIEQQGLGSFPCRLLFFKADVPQPEWRVTDLVGGAPFELIG